MGSFLKLLHESNQGKLKITLWKRTGSSMQMKKAVHLFIVIESVVVSVCNNNSHIGPPPALGPCTDKPLCSIASAASCNITGGSRSVYYWGWPAHVSHDTFSGVQVRDGETVCFSLLLPLRCCFTLGGQTGTPVSETHQACGWCPSCSIDVWNGSACHSS